MGIKEEGKRKIIKENLLRLVKILPFDSECAQIAAGIERELREKGQVIGPKNTMIAAKSLAKKVPIVNSNIRHFEKIENLDIYGIQALLEKLEKQFPYYLVAGKKVRERKERLKQTKTSLKREALNSFLIAAQKNKTVGGQCIAGSLD